MELWEINLRLRRALFLLRETFCRYNELVQLILISLQRVFGGNEITLGWVVIMLELGWS